MWLEGFGGAERSTVILETDEERTLRRRREYEEWIEAGRKQARRERIARRVLMVVAVVGILATVLTLVIVANATPRTGPGVAAEEQSPPVVTPSPVQPKKGMTVAQAEAECLRNGGFWFQDDEPDDMPPGVKVIGCLWAVPKGWK